MVNSFICLLYNIKHLHFLLTSHKNLSKIIFAQNIYAIDTMSIYRLNSLISNSPEISQIHTLRFFRTIIYETIVGNE